MPLRTYWRAQQQQTALDKFAWAYDPYAGFDVYPKTYRGPGWTGYVLDFQSGSWKPTLSSRPVWQHWLTVCVPDTMTQNVAAMYMDGPGNSETPDAQLNPVVDLMASNMNGG